MTAGSGEEHKRLKFAVMKHLGSKPWCRIWPKETGHGVAGGAWISVVHNGRRKQALVDGRRITFGIKGGADTDGVLKPDGRRLEVECKTGGARQSKQQKSFEKMITEFGGLYYVVRSTGDPDAAAAELAAAVELEVTARGWQG